MHRNTNTATATILVVDHRPENLEKTRRSLQLKGYKASGASGVREAIAMLTEKPFDLVLTELDLPPVPGMELVRYVREHCRHTALIVVTASPSVQSAVEAVKLGAEDYLSHPLQEEALLQAVEKALQKQHSARAAHRTINPKANVYGILGESKPMLQVFRVIEKISPTNASVLITGESGTGKELVARAIHYRSGRSSAPFVAVNCAAIPHELLESELFGHVKGSYTGASDTRAGFFQAAHGGTILLDEISSMSLSMQAKLLRVLQEKEFYMVGDKKPIRVDVRILAATNVDLPTLIRREAFREDLYYRLNVVNIQLPPLRERGDDLFLLLRLFSEKYARETGRQEAPTFTEKALGALERYHWPGNVRELQNVIYNMVIMAEGEQIDATDLPPALRYMVRTKPSLHRTLEEVEREYILQVLTSVGDNKSEAARILGIDRKTLREKLRP